MAKVVYSLKMKKDTKEFHLFRAIPSEDNGCIPENYSICKEMVRTDSSGNMFTCKQENEARIECAKIGRKVCGTCVSHLYETYKKS